LYNIFNMTLFMHNKIFLCACEQQDKGTQPSKIYIAYDIVIDSSMQWERQDALCVCVCVCVFVHKEGCFQNNFSLASLKGTMDILSMIATSI
jgi:hypothetical protein